MDFGAGRDMDFWMREIDRVYNSARVLEVCDFSRMAVVSDCHRGGGRWDDDFSRNKHIFLAALAHYDNLGYAWVELGDGDEMWENRNFADIAAVHGDVFARYARLLAEKRLFLLFGNHDMEKRRCGFMLRGGPAELAGAPVYEGLVLRCRGAGEVLLLHGHQADFFSGRLWRLARFLVRYLWKPLELIGLKNPTSAARNNAAAEKVEKRLDEWARLRKVMLIAGHTHRPVFPEPGGGMYFNDGCCVHPWSVTALEISGGMVALVKWSQKSRRDGVVCIARETIAGPRRLRDYFADGGKPAAKAQNAPPAR